MQINNNLAAMSALQLKLNESAQNIATVNSVSEPIDKEVTDDLINSIVEQIPTVISYEANANAIKTQNAIDEALLDIKAWY